MKKSTKLLLALGIIGLFFLFGCNTLNESNSNTQGFTLSRIVPMESDAENPELYIVGPEENEDKVILFVPALGEDIGTSDKIEYELENVRVTDTEIIIQFNEEEHHFDRLSESVAENEVGIQYEYRTETSE